MSPFGDNAHEFLHQDVPFYKNTGEKQNPKTQIFGLVGSLKIKKNWKVEKPMMQIRFRKSNHLVI